MKPLVSAERCMAVLQTAKTPEGECPDHLDCPICFLMLVNPQECSECRSYFCEPCIIALRTYTSQCPKCKRFMNAKPVGHISRQLIGKVKLSGCP